MTPPDGKHSVPELKETPEHLETLPDEREAGLEARRIEIPVLDEPVSEADFRDSGDEQAAGELEAQIETLAGQLEQRFSGELDELVRLLKANLKTSIVEELRRQVSPERDEDDKDPGSGHHPRSAS